MKSVAVAILLMLAISLFPITYTPLQFQKFHGHVESSIGFHVWSDHFVVRNLQLRGLLYTPWFLRINAVFRPSDREYLIIKEHHHNYYNTRFRPYIDELYAETIHNFSQSGWNLDLAAKVGRTRFLRFPYYFQTARFDRIPGVADLRGGDDTDYSGIIPTANLSAPFGLGYHVAAIQWLWNDVKGLGILENYLYYAPDVHPGILELRFGQLAQRTDPPGSTVQGASMLLGASWSGFSVGFFVERTVDDTFTGLLVNFAQTKITNALGRVRLDYTRSYQGLVFQIPFAQYNIGYASTPPADAQLVGTVEVDRAITFWRAGLMRNFYEHIASRTGSTDGDIIVMKEKPWYLGFEGLISTYKITSYSIDEMKRWNNSTTRPGQYSQQATYYIYRRRR